jgi:mannose-1-phosphate guanylyltransferase
MLHALIMAGGGGVRFWPRSRQARPKQFLHMAGTGTLLQQALERIEACALPLERAWVITAEAYRAETARQLPALAPDHVIGEPFGRDTAACIGLGAALVARHDPEAVLLVTPADHLIEPTREFARGVAVAERLVAEHPTAIVTFGIAPTYPAVGYGYIQRGATQGMRQGVSVFQVASFREKPALDLAEQYLASGDYLWNSGIFVWRADTILDALGQHRPEIRAAVQRIAEAWDSPQRLDVLQREYAPLQKISIDYAVLEKHQPVLVVQAPFGWDDVGSWLAVERLHPQDASGNTVLANHVGLQTRHCVIVGDDSRLIATLGVSDLLIVQDGDCTLIAHRSQEAAVKQLVEELRLKKQERYL